jgi:hypothetical protein
MVKHLTLDSGLRQLEEWADTAHQVHKNQLYKALFAITDRSVSHRYAVLQDTEDSRAHFVLVREDLVLKVNYPDDGTYGISYIGPMDDAPGIIPALQAL